MNKLRIFLAGREMQGFVAVLLLAAIADWPYGYYQFLRLAVCVTAAVSAWRLSKLKRPLWVLIMVGIALLFNPIIPVHFHRGEWAWIDALAALAFLAFPPLFNPKATP